MNPQKTSKLSWLYLTIEVLILSCFLLLIFLMLPSIIANHGFDAHAFLPPAMFMLLIAAGSYSLYCHIFFKDITSKEVTAHAFFAFCCLVFVGFLGLLEVELRSYRLTTMPAESFYTIFGFLCASALAGLLGWMRYIQLRICSTALESKAAKKSFYLRELFHLSVFLLFILLNAFHLWTTDFESHRSKWTKQSEVFVSRDEAPIPLPPNANRIHYSRRYNKYVIIEFDTDEESFVKWVEEETQPWPPHLKESLIEEIEFSAWPNRFYAGTDTFQGSYSVSVEDGLEYDRLLRKIHLHAIYDRETGRAYCERTEY